MKVFRKTRKFICLYLSKRTAIPTIVPANRINMPPEIKKGTKSPNSNVIVLSAFGARDGDKVASSKPSRKSRTYVSQNPNFDPKTYYLLK